jgi:uncharacterized lipoprotein YddW (UPF0748 family)
MRFCLAFCAVILMAGLACAGSLTVNPSAEEATDDGTPAGWGMYLGAGKARLARATDEKHSGQASACLELTGWHVPKDAKDAPENRSASAAIILAASDGYRAKGALPGTPGTTYAFSFWHKGDVPARVGVTGWPSADSDHTARIHLTVAGGTMRPGRDWQRCTGTFRLREGATCFALMITASGKESEGFRLGKLYVDDAAIMPKAFPDGQLRGIWCGLPKAKEPEPGRKEIAARLDKLKAAGFNAMFVWTTSLYLAALERPELRSAEPAAAWDAFGELARAAHERGMQVHSWYSPWIYKGTGRAIELRDHPEWAAVNAAGVADKGGVCLARPEVRQFELDLLSRLAERCPELDGIHIEEPGYSWGGPYCYCEHCRRLCRDSYGLDIAGDPPEARPLLDHLAASFCTDFILRLRQMLLARRPEMWLSANGSPGPNADKDWRIGRDWITWARRGYLDFYVPQIYTKSVEGFVQSGQRTKELLGPCDLVTGLAVSWSGIYPQRQEPCVIQDEIVAADKLGARGFVVFHLDHLNDEHFDAIREALKRPQDSPQKQ